MKFNTFIWDQLKQSKLGRKSIYFFSKFKTLHLNKDVSKINKILLKNPIIRYYGDSDYYSIKNYIDVYIDIYKNYILKYPYKLKKISDVKKNVKMAF